MTEMIERAARALCENHIRTVRFWDTLPQRLNEMMPQSVDDNWQEFIPQAIAAIKAMREPTVEMLDASWHQAGESKEMRTRTHVHYKRHYQTMIDAALGDKK